VSLSLTVMRGPLMLVQVTCPRGSRRTKVFTAIENPAGSEAEDFVYKNIYSRPRASREIGCILMILWSGRRDSNSRPPAPKATCISPHCRFT